MTRTGKCLCGAVRFTAEIDKPQFSACHCGMCLRWVGGPALAVVTRAVKVEDDANLGVYRSSDFAERTFCKVCGSSLFYRITAEGPHKGLHTVQLGTLDDVSGLAFGEEIFVDCKPDAYAFVGERKRMTEPEVLAMFSGGGA